MAVVQYVQCDLCHSKESVSVLEIEYARKGWQLDVCQDCFDKRLADVVKRGSKPRTRTRGGKNTYISDKIEIGPENL